MPDRRRIVMVIDALGPGGAQRQFAMLAAGLRRLGHETEALTYWPGDFFAGELAAAGVPAERVRAGSRPRLALAMRSAIRRRDPDAVIAFLPGPGMLAELAGLPRRGFAVIASERNVDGAGRSLRRALRHALHRFADAVVTNSHAQRERIAALSPALEARTHVVVNGVDLERFAPPQDGGEEAGGESGRLRLLTPARLQPQKNPLALIEAVAIVRRERPALDLAVDWYGDPVETGGEAGGGRWARRARERQAGYARRVVEAIAGASLEGRFRLHRAVPDPAPLYRAADAVCLPSLSEGTPNAVLEAMACGAPVLAGRAGDTPRLVADGRNGLLFDARSPRAVADAILRFADLPPGERRRMGREGRAAAEAMLSPDAFAGRWADLVERAIAGRRPDAAAPARPARRAREEA